MSNKPISQLDSKVKPITGEDLVLLTQRGEAGLKSVKTPINSLLTDSLNGSNELASELNSLRNSLQNMLAAVNGNVGGIENIISNGLSNLNNLLNNHINIHPDPHPRYFTTLETNQRIKEFAQQIWPIGSWHGTDDTAYDPAVALQAFLGASKWIRVPYAQTGVSKPEDVSVLTSRSHVGGEANPAFALNDPSVATDVGVTKRFTNIWLRVPDDLISDYTLTSDKSSLLYGDIVTITLSSQQAPVGLTLDWGISGAIALSGNSGQLTIGSNGKATVSLRFQDNININPTNDTNVVFSVNVPGGKSIIFRVYRQVEQLGSFIAYAKARPALLGNSSDLMKTAQVLDYEWMSFENKTMEQIVSQGATGIYKGKTLEYGFKQRGFDFNKPELMGIGHISLLVEYRGTTDVLNTTYELVTVDDDDHEMGAGTHVPTLIVSQNQCSNEGLYSGGYELWSPLHMPVKKLISAPLFYPVNPPNEPVPTDFNQRTNSKYPERVAGYVELYDTYYSKKTVAPDPRIAGNRMYVQIIVPGFYAGNSDPRKYRLRLALNGYVQDIFIDNPYVHQPADESKFNMAKLGPLKTSAAYCEDGATMLVGIGYNNWTAPAQPYNQLGVYARIRMAGTPLAEERIRRLPAVYQTVEVYPPDRKTVKSATFLVTDVVGYSFAPAFEAYQNPSHWCVLLSNVQQIKKWHTYTGNFNQTNIYEATSYLRGSSNPPHRNLANNQIGDVAGMQLLSEQGAVFAYTTRNVTPGSHEVDLKWTSNISNGFPWKLTYSVIAR